ncbi:hypothetical protein FJR38_16610 [Anabaena sp. UHCC 0253]|uniref:hypothetical protein n=1 Tax=Anabaena sp. UHCC 0253 TaxID=2590019 RepID=UPI001446131C|nr:hypothetical protein [Anabaena sp. UHCC 0253]MTJ54152.1 hypothetical protein [Anabaena sp. UHCC 0253]
MVIEPGQTRCKYYEGLLEQKKEELNAVLRQQGKVLADIDKVKLDRQAEDILKKIEDLESQILNISNIDKSTSNKNNIENQLEKALQKIDFNKAREIAESLKKQYEKEGGAILLFLHKSKKQLGKYCIEEFIDVIISNQIGTCPRRTINFSSTTYQPNKAGFINAISAWLGITITSELEKDENEDEDILLSKIYEKICSSLSLGDTIFFEIKSINRLEDKEEFITWFIEKFWKSLISNKKFLFQQRRNRLIFALIAESQFLINSSNFCQEVTLNHDKMIEIPLHNWTIEDISNWLILHYKLFPCFANIQNCDEIHKEAKNIHEESEGTPESVYTKLKEYFHEQN